MRLSALTIYVGTQFIYEDSNGTKVFAFGQGGTIDESNAASLGLVNVFIDNGRQIVFVPEPSTWMLMLAGTGLLGLVRWRRRK